MKEGEMFDPVVEYLQNLGYRILEQHRGHERGTDVVATKDGVKIFVELKGDTAALDVDLGTAIYQVMKIITQGRDEYCIAVSERYLPYVKRCRYGLVKLGVGIIVVSPSGVEPC